MTGGVRSCLIYRISPTLCQNFRGVLDGRKLEDPHVMRVRLIIVMLQEFSGGQNEDQAP